MFRRVIALLLLILAVQACMAEGPFVLDDAIGWDSTMEEVLEYFGDDVSINTHDGSGIVTVLKEHGRCCGIETERMIVWFYEEEPFFMAFMYTEDHLDNKEDTLLELLSSYYGEAEISKPNAYTLEEYLEYMAGRTILWKWHCGSNTLIEVYKEANERDPDTWAYNVRVTNLERTERVNDTVYGSQG